MAERLGQVLYWLGCIVTVLWLALGLAVGLSPRGVINEIGVAFWLGTALVPFGIGRACLYVLAGR